MGHNPRYRMWTRENWQGYAPTIFDVWRRGWSLSAHCWTCRLAMVADAETIMKVKGRDWSPWGKTARCRRMHCSGRMTLKAYAPGPNEHIDL